MRTTLALKPPAHSQILKAATQARKAAIKAAYPTAKAGVRLAAPNMDMDGVIRLCDGVLEGRFHGDPVQALAIKTALLQSHQSPNTNEPNITNESAA